MLAALDHAHRAATRTGGRCELMHRDVNPPTCSLAQTGEVKLTDFGIARAGDAARLTQAGLIKGKPGYIAPEQARGEPLDVRADLFPVATMLYELLTLQRAFPEGPLGPPPPSIYQVRGDLPVPLLDVIARGLAMDRQERWPSAEAFRDALLSASAPLGRVSEADVADWLAGLPVGGAAPPPPPATHEATRTSTVPPPK